MGRRGMSAEEADDFISEHGTGVTPMEVVNRAEEDREEALRRDAARYRYLRGDGTAQTAYEPEEAGVWGGKELDDLCDRGIERDRLKEAQREKP